MDPPATRVLKLNNTLVTVVTTVTCSSTTVEDWISIAERSNFYRHKDLVVGLGVQWRRHEGTPEVAVLQLCIGTRCLIFQLLHADAVPERLRNFLNNSDITFVGARNRRHNYLLLNSSHRLSVSRLVDLQTVARRRRMLSEAARVATSILGVNLIHRNPAAELDWNARWLSDDQIKFACVEASLSFLLGTALKVWNWYRVIVL